MGVVLWMDGAIGVLDTRACTLWRNFSSSVSSRVLRSGPIDSRALRTKAVW